MVKNGRKLTVRRSCTRPDLTNSRRSKASLVQSTFSKDKISFSFAYFEQRDKFGVGDMSPHWFVSLIERLKDISGKTIGFWSDYIAKRAYRIHPINWSQPNIPLKREDLTTIPIEYRMNEDDFPLLQLEISQGTGRIIGFFAESSSVFFIALLDPKHNMQPTQLYGYKVDDTRILPTLYESAINEAQKCIHTTDCPLLLKKHLKNDMARIIFVDNIDNEVLQEMERTGKCVQTEFQKFVLENI